MVRTNPFPPGFCVKTNSSEGKVFINICHSPSIPPPADMTEDQLLQMLEEDQAGFRIPMSLGEPHAELDASQYPQRTRAPGPQALPCPGPQNPGPRSVLREDLETPSPRRTPSLLGLLQRPHGASWFCPPGPAGTSLRLPPGRGPALLANLLDLGPGQLSPSSTAPPRLSPQRAVSQRGGVFSTLSPVSVSLPVSPLSLWHFCLYVLAFSSLPGPRFGWCPGEWGLIKPRTWGFNIA